MEPNPTTGAAPILHPVSRLDPEVLVTLVARPVLDSEVLSIQDDGSLIILVGQHHITVTGDIGLVPGEHFQFSVQGSDHIELHVLNRPAAVPSAPAAEPTAPNEAPGTLDARDDGQLAGALRERLTTDLPVGRVLTELTGRLRTTLTGSGSDAPVIRLLSELTEHAFRPGTDGYVLRDLVTRSGLGFESALAHASEFMLEGDIQPPSTRSLAAAWVRGLAGETAMRPATARQLEEKLVRELLTIHSSGERELPIVMRRLGQVMLDVLLARSTVTMRDSLLARADALTNNTEFPDREVDLLRIWLGMPPLGSERLVTLWLAQTSLTPWLRDLKARLLRTEAELEDGKARRAVQRALDGLELEQLLNLARAEGNEGWLASFPIMDGDVRGTWTTAHLLHRMDGDAENPQQNFVLGVEFSQIGPVRAEFTMNGCDVRLRVVIERHETASVLRRRLVELHSLFEGGDAQVQLSVLQGHAGDASVESLLEDIKFLEDNDLLAAARSNMQRSMNANLTDPVSTLNFQSVGAYEHRGHRERGMGTATDRMMALARKENIPLRTRDPELLKLMATSEIGEEIPVGLYEVVARLLTYLYELKDKLD